jgi:stage II sporulation protein GA (sporulation sigma-E factor processing peptidase)
MKQADLVHRLLGQSININNQPLSPGGRCKGVYIDLVLALNLAVNYLLLRLTGLIIRKKTSLRRLLLGSLLGTAFLLTLFLPGNLTFYIWSGKILLPIAMILLTFQPRQWTQGLLFFIVFYLCSFAMGGVVFAFTYWGSYETGYCRGIYYLPAPSVFYVLSAASLLYIAVRWVGPVLVEKLNFKLPATELQIKVCFSGKIKSYSAFLDTGNMLREPFSGSPVVVISHAIVKEMLPPEISNLISNQGGIDWNALSTALAGLKNPSRFSLVPYQTLSGENFLFSFRPESVMLVQNGREIEFINEVVIGVQPGQFAPEAEYEALLPLELWRMAKDREGLYI